MADYISNSNTPESIRLFQEADFTKEELELLLGYTMAEGGVDLQEIERMVMEWRSLKHQGIIDEILESAGRKESDSTTGLYDKYTIINNKSGEPIDEDAFVLKPDKDPAARKALITYAVNTKNERLRNNLYDWVERITAFENRK